MPIAPASNSAVVPAFIDAKTDTTARPVEENDAPHLCVIGLAVIGVRIAFEMDLR
jgi:hypothetical protein